MTILAPPLPPPTLGQHDTGQPSGASPSRRAATWALRTAALAAIATSIALDRSLLLLVPLLFVLIVPFEKMFPRHRGQRIRRPLAWLDIRYALLTTLTGLASLAVGIVIAVVSFAWLPGLALRPLVAMIPASIAPFVGIALFDLAIYWGHRWSHEVPALWRFHAVHHSTEHLDWVSGFRTHPLDGAIIAPPAVFLIAAGFDAEFTGVLAVVQIVTGLFLHANVRWRWRPLHRIVITPEFHHWHHSYELDAHNSNYSVFLPLWDIVFGTYYMPRNKRPARYGIAEEMPTTMLGQLRYPFRNVRPVRNMFRHPLAGARAGVRVIGSILRDSWGSTTRPRTRRPKPGEPLAWTFAPPSVAPTAPLDRA